MTEFLLFYAYWLISGAVTLVAVAWDEPLPSGDYWGEAATTFALGFIALPVFIFFILPALGVYRVSSWFRGKKS